MAGKTEEKEEVEELDAEEIFNEGEDKVLTEMEEGERKVLDADEKLEKEIVKELNGGGEE